MNPIVQFGAIPVFVDVDLHTHNVNADLIEQAITPKTKAIMLAHTLGNPFNLEKIKAKKLYQKPYYSLQGMSDVQRILKDTKKIL